MGCIGGVHPPDSKVHGANMRPTWVLSVPDGPHVGPMNLVIGAYYRIKKSHNGTLVITSYMHQLADTTSSRVGSDDNAGLHALSALKFGAALNTFCFHSSLAIETNLPLQDDKWLILSLFVWFFFSCSLDQSRESRLMLHPHSHGHWWCPLTYCPRVVKTPWNPQCTLLFGYLSTNTETWQTIWKCQGLGLCRD